MSSELLTNELNNENQEENQNNIDINLGNSSNSK